jgi:hypothetical protein
VKTDVYKALQAAIDAFLCTQPVDNSYFPRPLMIEGIVTIRKLDFLGSTRIADGVTFVL